MGCSATRFFARPPLSFRGSVPSEIEELIGLCDRMLVMFRGTLSSCYRRGEFNREAILRAALGSERIPLTAEEQEPANPRKDDM